MSGINKTEEEIPNGLKQLAEDLNDMEIKNDNPNEIKLYVGSGMLALDGFLRVDNDPAVKPDILLDLETDKFPFEDNSVSVIYSKSCLEHVHDLTNFFEESYRILNKETGLIHLNLPYYLHETSFTDPEHVWFFTPYFFTTYLQRTSLGSDGRPIITGNFDYRITRFVELIEDRKSTQVMMKNLFNDRGENPDIIVDMLRYLANVVRSMEIKMVPVFPMRVPSTDYPPTYVKLRRN